MCLTYCYISFSVPFQTKPKFLTQGSWRSYENRQPPTCFCTTSNRYAKINGTTTFCWKLWSILQFSFKNISCIPAIAFCSETKKNKYLCYRSALPINHINRHICPCESSVGSVWSVCSVSMTNHRSFFIGDGATSISDSWEGHFYRFDNFCGRIHPSRFT